MQPHNLPDRLNFQSLLLAVDRSTWKCTRIVSHGSAWQSSAPAVSKGWSQSRLSPLQHLQWTTVPSSHALCRHCTSWPMNPSLRFKLSSDLHPDLVAANHADYVAEAAGRGLQGFCRCRNGAEAFGNNRALNVERSLEKACDRAREVHGHQVNAAKSTSTS